VPAMKEEVFIQSASAFQPIESNLWALYTSPVQGWVKQ